MLRFSLSKVLLVLAVVLGGLYLLGPSLLTKPQDDALRASPLGVLWPRNAIALGLDLQGGSHVLLEVDVADLTRVQVRALQDDVRRVLRDNRVALSGGVGLLPRGVQARVPNPEDRARALPKLRELITPVGGALGASGTPAMELREGADGAIALTLTDAGLNERVARAANQSIEVIRRRVDALGTTEPNIQRQGVDRVLVQVPGLQDPQRLKDILGQTAKLEFRLVAATGANPGEVETFPSVEDAGRPVTVERRVLVQGEDLTSAEPGFDQQRGEPIVNFRFNQRGAQRFAQVTTENVGKPFAIVLDNKVISAPVIQTPILQGSGQISGRFTVEAANNLAILLRAGALPAKLSIVEERTVGPGLGRDSVEAGRKAVFVALALVIAFMFATYGVFGLFANIALLVHVMLIFGLMSAIGATLTLPGIAGIVLTIGTAVDSNVLIYERIREERAAGRSVVSSLEAGFDRAFATIMDSNVTMLIAAALLFLLGSGPVRGFAVTLILGVLTTVITAVTMTRMMIALWYRLGRPKALPI